MDNRTAAIFILWLVLIVTFLLLVGAFDYFQAQYGNHYSQRWRLEGA